MDNFVRLKNFIKRSYIITCILYLLTDIIAILKYRFISVKNNSSGVLHQKLKTEESVKYIQQVFEDYKSYSGIFEFKGEVAEIGPGDNCGVGLLFLADGCQSVDLIDRFFSNRDILQQTKIYKKLAEHNPKIKKFIKNIDLKDNVTEEDIAGISRYYGNNAQAETFFKKSKKRYDYIISRAVCEHLSNPKEAFDAMISALKPGGMLIHKIDLRDHGMFSDYHHELKFLEIPEWAYGLMTRGSGRPNRFLIEDYRGILESYRLQYSILVTSLVAVGEICPHLQYEEIPNEIKIKANNYVLKNKQKLCGKFNHTSVEDLSVSGIFIIARMSESVNPSHANLYH